LSCTGSIIPIRKEEGKVRGSKFRYLFRSYDSSTAPKELDLGKVIKLFKRDKDLKERKRGDIEEYVDGFYGD